MQNQSPDAIYTLKGLKRRFGDRLILNIPSAHIEAGRITVIVGSNGAGKTTLLRILAFLDAPSEGELHFKNSPIDFSRRIDIGMRRRVTLVMQDHFIFSASVIENAAYGLRKRGARRADAQMRARKAIESVGLAESANHDARRLSGGEGKRLAIARALAIEPEVLLLDEPTANVDVESTRAIEDMVRSIKRERGVTIVMTTHDRSQAERLGERVMTIVDGRLVDTPNENVFLGEIRGEGELRSMELCTGVVVWLDTGRMGRAHIVIEPASIVLSRTRFESSARNAFAGKVSRVVMEGNHSKVSVDVGVELVALVTTRSFQEMKLGPGEPVWVTFKSTSIRVLG